MLHFQAGIQDLLVFVLLINGGHAYGVADPRPPGHQQGSDATHLNDYDADPAGFEISALSDNHNEDSFLDHSTRHESILKYHPEAVGLQSNPRYHGVPEGGLQFSQSFREESGIPSKDHFQESEYNNNLDDQSFPAEGPPSPSFKSAQTEAGLYPYDQGSPDFPSRPAGKSFGQPGFSASPHPSSSQGFSSPSSGGYSSPSGGHSSNPSSYSSPSIAHSSSSPFNSPNSGYSSSGESFHTSGNSGGYSLPSGGHSSSSGGHSSPSGGFNSPASGQSFGPAPEHASGSSGYNAPIDQSSSYGSSLSSSSHSSNSGGFSSGQNSYSSGPYVEPPHQPRPYSYSYHVNDDYKGTNFNANEDGDGHGNVKGSYSVQMPDGRTQHVNYKADDYGYVADVAYDGQAHYNTHPTEVKGDISYDQPSPDQTYHNTLKRSADPQVPGQYFPAPVLPAYNPGLKPGSTQAPIHAAYYRTAGVHDRVKFYPIDDNSVDNYPSQQFNDFPGRNEDNGFLNQYTTSNQYSSQGAPTYISSTSNSYGKGNTDQRFPASIESRGFTTNNLLLPRKDSVEHSNGGQSYSSFQLGQQSATSHKTNKTSYQKFPSQKLPYKAVTSTKSTFTNRNYFPDNYYPRNRQDFVSNHTPRKVIYKPQDFNNQGHFRTTKSYRKP